MAGILLGFTLSAAMAGLYALLGPQAVGENLIIAVVAMFPAWIASWSFAYVPASAGRVWGWLLLGNVIAYGMLWLAKQHTGWAA
jgi:hypothetical protein